MALCLLFLEDKHERDKRKGGTVEELGWDREGRERESRNFMTCVLYRMLGDMILLISMCGPEQLAHAGTFFDPVASNCGAHTTR